MTNTLGPTLIALSVLIVLEMRARPDAYRTAEVTGVAWLLVGSLAYTVTAHPTLLWVVGCASALWLAGLSRRLRRRA